MAKHFIAGGLAFTAGALLISGFWTAAIGLFVASCAIMSLRNLE